MTWRTEFLEAKAHTFTWKLGFFFFFFLLLRGSVSRWPRYLQLKIHKNISRLFVRLLKQTYNTKKTKAVHNLFIFLKKFVWQCFIAFPLQVFLLMLITYYSILFRSKSYLYLNYLLVRVASPVSVIWRASKLRDLRDVSPDNFLKPPSVTTVNDKFKLSRLVKPTGNKQTQYQVTTK